MEDAEPEDDEAPEEDPDGDEPWHALSAASPDLHHVTGPGQGRMNERLAILRESPLAHAIVSFEDF